ncbi:hypothetical protein THERMOT_1436 [Bathymodiolus thermophilus thioautotrophic gill symbiont]|uniref:Uncharacterized protein n=1 Tax=Bathymodiolus thermophilus thioautotrophic gill symbiont TaxID=2360 RepID=A0A8H8XGK7_9GAMM|nr:hypothetical protein THERMOT_1436 [Bathymodiolus thermophilus thioautotrophic gill symbiont]CAB5504423.1 hypothetical protein THERMOS_1956 [Bathymodiolus thermophilus thioautotrophic gill symbiont]
MHYSFARGVIFVFCCKNVRWWIWLGFVGRVFRVKIGFLKIG